MMQVLLKFLVIIFFIFTICFCKNNIAHSVAIIGYVNNDIITSKDLTDRIKIIEIFNNVEIHIDDYVNVFKLILNENFIYQVYKKNKINKINTISLSLLNSFAKKHMFNNFSAMCHKLNIYEKSLIKIIESQKFEKDVYYNYVKLKPKVAYFDFISNFDTVPYIQYVNNFTNFNIKISLNMIIIFDYSLSMQFHLVKKLIKKEKSFDIFIKRYLLRNLIVKNNLMLWFNLYDLSSPVLKAFKHVEIGSILKPIKIFNKILLLQILDKKNSANRYDVRAIVKDVVFKRNICFQEEDFIRSIYNIFYIKISNNIFYNFLYTLKIV